MKVVWNKGVRDKKKTGRTKADEELQMLCTSGKESH